jgi:hypothetical protein
MGGGSSTTNPIFHFHKIDAQSPGNIFEGKIKIVT